jgi:cytochrome c oxidase subunit 2
MTRILPPVQGAVLSVLPLAEASADWTLNMPIGVTDISAEIYDLHMMVMGVCALIGAIVFGLMIYALVNHRKSKGVEPAQFSHDTRAEVIWMTLPALIIIALSVPAAKTLVKIEDNRDTEMTIKITGYQWKWHYDYLGKNVSYYSSLAYSSNAARRLDSGIDPYDVENYLLEVDRPLVVPTDTKIRYLLTSNDVIHAWWVPEFAVKKDAIPGFINEGWFKINEPGTYRGQCAELCGKDHGFMPIVVEALPKEEYSAWLAAQGSEGTVAESVGNTGAEHAG